MLMRYLSMLDTEGDKIDMYNVYWFDNEFSYLITGEISFEDLLKVIEGIIKK